MSISSAQVGNLMENEAIPREHRDNQSSNQSTDPEEFIRFEAMIVQSDYVDALYSNCTLRLSVLTLCHGIQKYCRLLCRCCFSNYLLVEAVYFLPLVYKNILKIYIYPKSADLPQIVLLILNCSTYLL